MRSRPTGPPDTTPRLAALRLLGRRDYTSGEIARKLVEKGHPREDVDAVVQDLIAQGLLNDTRVAAAHVRTASAIKGRGRMRIRRELEARGVDKETAAQAIAAIPDEDEAAAIARFLERKRVPRPLPAAEHRRLFQQLLRRGFSSDAIARAFKYNRLRDR